MPSPDPTEIQRAFALHGAGRLAEAERAYRNILQKHPGEANSAHMLGMLLFQQGDHASAEPLLRMSLKKAYQAPEWYSNFALFCRSTGRLEEALVHIRRAAELRPASAQTQDNLGLILDDLARPEQAATAYAAAIAADPRFALAHHHLAQNLWKTGQRQKAIEHWRTAVSLEPRLAEAHGNLSAALGELGQMEACLQHGRAALGLNPNDADAHVNVGVALAHQGDSERAAAHLQQALRLVPNHIGALFNIAWLLHRVGRFDQAVQYCRHVVQFVPGHAAAYNQLGWSLRELRQIDPAIDACRRATELSPGRSEHWINLGLCQMDLGDFRASAECFRRAIAARPEDAVARSNLLLVLHYDPQVTAGQMFQEHQEFGRCAEAAAGPAMIYQQDRDPQRPLRIGYASPYFRFSAVACFLEPILRSHDRSQFTITCYSDVRAADPVTTRFRSLASRWIDSANLSDDKLAQVIHSNQEDILIDLTGHIAGSRLMSFARKPAPVQVTYLGYQYTTGLKVMDYRLTDAIADPVGSTEAFHVEQLWRLGCFFCYQPLDAAPPVGPLPAAAAGGITFGSLNHSVKCNPSVMRLWARVLQEVPNSRLMLLITSPGGCAARLSQMLAAEGVSPDRLLLTTRRSHSEYLSLYNSIDIALDPFPFSGHTTTCDALWMGVPVITLAGATYASRMSASVLTHLGAPQWIADSPERYIEIAKSLAEDRSGLAATRAGLRQRMSDSVVTNPQAFTRDLESAYRGMWQRWCSVGR